MPNSREEFLARLQELLDALEHELPNVRKAVGAIPEASNEAKTELEAHLLDLDVSLASLSTAFAERTIRSLPGLAVEEFISYAEGLHNLFPHFVKDPTGQQAAFQAKAKTLLHSLYLNRLIDPLEEERVFSKAAGNLQSGIAEARAYIEELKEGLKLRDQARSIAEEAARLRDDTKSSSAEADEHKAEAGKRKAETESHLDESRQLLEQAQETISTLDKLLKTGEDRDSTLRGIEATLKQWHEEIDTRREGITELRDSTEKRLAELDESTKNRLANFDNDTKQRRARLDEVEVKIGDHFRLAASGALAKSFGDRGTKLLKWKYGWGILASVSYLCAVGFTIWFVGRSIPAPLADGTVPEFAWQYFLVRVSGMIPFGFLIWFCTSQYTKARRLQEAYVFKGVVASSFDAYRELIETITKDEALKGNPEYARFITETIQGLYAPPGAHKDSDERLPLLDVAKEFGESSAKLIKELGVFASKLPR